MPPSPEAIGNIWPMPTSARKEAAARLAVTMPNRKTGERREDQAEQNHAGDDRPEPGLPRQPGEAAHAGLLTRRVRRPIDAEQHQSLHHRQDRRALTSRSESSVPTRTRVSVPKSAPIGATTPPEKAAPPRITAATERSVIEVDAGRIAAARARGDDDPGQEGEEPGEAVERRLGAARRPAGRLDRARVGAETAQHRAVAPDHQDEVGDDRREQAELAPAAARSALAARSSSTSQSGAAAAGARQAEAGEAQPDEREAERDDDRRHPPRLDEQSHQRVGDEHARRSTRAASQRIGDQPGRGHAR